jgi:GAF domain-containing protein
MNSTPPFPDLTTLSDAPVEALTETVRLVGETLRADRCFLYVRQPAQRQGRTAFCWRRTEAVPDAILPQYKPDTTDLPAEDPLIRAGLAGKPSVFVDDVETAGPDVLNRDFEARNLGHRALIHAHIHDADGLWGILQPSVFGQPRPWTEPEKTWIESLLPVLLPIVRAYSTSPQANESVSVIGEPGAHGRA